MSPTKTNTEPNVAPQGATREPEFQGGARPEAQATADHREASASARSGAPRGAASSSTRRINILPSRPASVPQPGIAAAMTRDGEAAARAIAGDSTGIATRTDMSLDAPRGASAPSAAAEADGSTAMAVATGGTGLRSQPVEAVVPRAEQVAPQARQQGQGDSEQAPVTTAPSTQRRAATSSSGRTTSGPVQGEHCLLYTSPSPRDS